MSPTDPWLLLDSGVCDFALNMALDDALLQGARELRHPVLRFYGWMQPAASFGYFQKISDIEAVTALRPLVRRPTGGGLVPHNADWTYSVTVPPAHPWYELHATESYERMHRWIRDAFSGINVATELAPCAHKEAPGQCFAGYEQHDLLWFGRKIAGAAQRRTKTGLLIQGSVQPPPPGIGRGAWQEAMQAAAKEQWNVQWTDWKAPPDLIRCAEELRDANYARDDYNRRR